MQKPVFVFMYGINKWCYTWYIHSDVEREALL